MNSAQAKIQELERRNRELEQQLSKQVCAEIDARSASEDAIQTAQAKDDFLANISHELRTPMHGILSFSRFGMQKVADAPRDKLANYFEQINTSATRLMGLLNDLLDLSKHSEAKFEYHFEEITILDILNAVVLEFNASIREKELTIDVEKSTPTRIQCDQGKVRQVLSNLLTNAIKYSESGQRLEFRFAPAELEINHRKTQALKISLADQGIGIPDDELKDVFGKFFQSTRTRMGAGGSGLGLAICKEIVHAHQGMIEADHNPTGQGTVFSFTLPVKQPNINREKQS